MDTVRSQLVMLNQNAQGVVNYVPWRLKLDAVLRNKKLYEVATGIKVKPEGAEDVAAVVEWNEKDMEALQLIVLNVSDQIAYKIANCRTSRAMLDRLVCLYGTKTEMNMEVMRRKLFTCTFDESKSVVENCMEILSIGDELSNGGEPVPESWMMTRILKMLPSRLAHFRTSWDNVPAIDKSLTTMIERLRLEDDRQHDETGEPEASSSNALMAKKCKKQQGKSPNKKDKGQGNCYKCGLKGHFRKDCQNKPCAKYLAYCKRMYACNSCGQKGHFAKDCTQRRDDNSDSQGSRKPPVVWMTASLKTTDLDNLTNSKERMSAWYQDSGATQHMTSHRSWFKEYCKLEKSVSVLLGDSTTIDGVAVGTVELEAFDGKEWNPIVLKDVLHVPELKFNLFSVSRMLDRGFKMRSDKEKSEFVTAHDGSIVGLAKREGNLYKMMIRKGEQQLSLAAVSIRTWHERLAHQNVNYVREALDKKGIKYVDDWNNYLCVSCTKGKQHRGSHPNDGKTASQPLELVHVDMGEMDERSLGGAKYFLLFKDDFSHFRTVFFMKTKDEAPEKLETFVKLAENQLGRKLKVLKSDQGKEIKNARTRKFLDDRGIFHIHSNVYTPQQNGRIEREMRTIKEAAVSALLATNLDSKLWAEAIYYAVFTINQTGTSTVKGKTPAELWYGRQIDLNKLKIFGCECYVLIQDHKRGKLDPKSEKGYFVGYDVESPSYRVYFPRTREIVSSGNVKFDEEKEANSTEVETVKIEELIEVINEESEEYEDAEEGQYTDENREIEEVRRKEERVETPKNSPERRQLRDRSKLKAPQMYGFHVAGYVRGGNDEELALIGDIEDISVEMALKDENWKRAMQDEYDSLVERQTWKLVECPEGVKPLTCRWVLREKANGKLKARLVARGFEQREGIDYGETFSPVARYASIRLILSHAASEKWKVISFDVKTAFLYGKLERALYMNQPQGFDDGSGLVCQLFKAIYGLKQAPKQWNREITGSFEEIGLFSTDDDPSVFYNKDRTIIVALFVDDGLVAGKEEKEIFKLLEQIKKKFEITHCKTIPKEFCYLGMEIKIESDGISVNQPRYVEKILRRMNLENCNPAPTPMEPGMVTKKEELLNDEKVPIETPYREAIGSLLYLANLSRPDISFAVNYLSRQCCNPMKSHWKMTKRVFQYLKGTRNAGIRFGGDKNFKVFTDADFGGEKETMKSTSGGLILRGGPLVWYSQRQKLVATSTAEAEYRAACEVIDDVCWMRRLATELKILQDAKPFPMFVDNKSAVHMLMNTHEGKVNKGKKHIEIARKFIQQHVDVTVAVEHVESAKQIADILTKPLNKNLFLKFCNYLIEKEC